MELEERRTRTTSGYGYGGGIDLRLRPDLLSAKTGAEEQVPDQNTGTAQCFAVDSCRTSLCR